MTIGIDSVVPRMAVGSLLLACVAMLAACGNSASSGSQVVASVGGEEITETQVNHALERQANIRPDQLDGASRKAVTSLVEQSIVLQKARDLKLDRDERVMQDIEAMKRELIVNAYLGRIAEGAGKPAEKDIQAYYDEHPELFSQRRTYAFQELTLDVPSSQFKDIEAQLTQLKSSPEIGEYLKARQIPVRSAQSTIQAENIPQALLKRVAPLKPGQGVIVSNDGGLRILMLLDAKDSPLAEADARPLITAYLVTQNKRQAIQKEVASLTTATKVSYFGKYADMAASAPAAATSAVAMGSPASVNPR